MKTLLEELFSTRSGAIVSRISSPVTGQAEVILAVDHYRNSLFFRVEIKQRAWKDIGNFRSIFFHLVLAARTRAGVYAIQTNQIVT